jgi:hypothetical protein
MMVDTKVCATTYKFCSFELSPVIYEDPYGYEKPIYDTLQELDRCFLCNVYHWHNFHPLSDCVDCDEQKSESS